MRSSSLSAAAAAAEALQVFEDQKFLDYNWCCSSNSRVILAFYAKRIVEYKVEAARFLAEKQAELNVSMERVGKAREEQNEQKKWLDKWKRGEIAVEDEEVEEEKMEG